MDVIKPNEREEAWLRDRESDGWQRIEEAREALEPIVLERIKRRVRTHVADATAIFLEPSDQGGPGWVLESTVLSDGLPLDVKDARAEGLGDDDELTTLLLGLGEFLSSESEPYPYELPLDREEKPMAPAPVSWGEFWSLVYSPAVDSGEPPREGTNALFAADTCASLYTRFAPDPGATHTGRILWETVPRCSSCEETVARAVDRVVAPDAPEGGSMAVRLANLRRAVAEGVGRARRPREIYDSRTLAMRAGMLPVERYLCVTETGYETNPYYVVVGSLRAARKHFDSELNGARQSLPLALVDLDTGREITERVRLRTQIDSART